MPVRVKLGSRAYDIQIGPGTLSKISDLLIPMHNSGARKAFVVVDTGVPQYFVTKLSKLATDAGLEVALSPITPTEKIKSIQTYHQLLEQIALTGHSRVDPVIALGGGIVGDLAGFVAASYRRGVPVIQCPTTLLSMVDASVGGKTGFNLQVTHPQGSTTLLKNLVGAFCQPSAVIADIDTLDSLDARQRRSGLSECIKHGFISSEVGHEGLLDWMKDNQSQITQFDPTIITQLVHRNTALKASVVASDEREDPSARPGGRMLLNFGHTFSHAIETIAHLSPDPSDSSQAPLHHGEAVGLGMIAACRAAEVLDLASPQIRQELTEILNQVGLPTKLSQLPDNSQLIETMRHDKKATADSIRVILPTGRGHCSVIDNASIEAISAGFDAIRA